MIQDGTYFLFSHVRSRVNIERERGRIVSPLGLLLPPFLLSPKRQSRPSFDSFFLCSIRIHFSITEAPWITFASDKTIQCAFDPTHMGTTDELVAKWVHRAESAVISFIINQVIAKEGRADAFRALGRGWIFVFLRRRHRKFKWWFEDLSRILRNHKHDITALDLRGPCLEKYTRGYVCQSEIVFCMKGLTRMQVTDPTLPVISIQKMANTYKFLHRWATNEDTRKSVMSPFPTDEERRLHAAKAAKREEKTKRKRMRRRRDESLDEDVEEDESDDHVDNNGAEAPKLRTNALETDDTFATLLQRFKDEIRVKNDADEN